MNKMPTQIFFPLYFMSLLFFELYLYNWLPNIGQLILKCKFGLWKESERPAEMCWVMEFHYGKKKNMSVYGFGADTNFQHRLK